MEEVVMGWWSPTILGGDQPLDYRGSLCDVIGISPLEDNPENMTEKVNSHIGELINRADSLGDPIALEVLASIILESGAGMPDKLKNSILEAINTDKEGIYSWGNLRSDREFFLNDLENKINGYPREGGNPTKLSTESLCDAFNKRGFNR